MIFTLMITIVCFYERVPLYSTRTGGYFVIQGVIQLYMYEYGDYQDNYMLLV